MKQIESLEAQLHSTTDDNDRIQLLNELVWLYGHTNLERSEALLNEAATFLSRLSDLDSQFTLVAHANYITNSAQVDTYYGRYEGALQKAKQVLAMCTDTAHAFVRCRALEIAGITQIRLGNHADALAQLIEALRIANLLGDQKMVTTIYNSFAILYVNLGNDEAGATYFRKSLACAKFIGDQIGQARALVNLCMSYRDIGDYDESIRCGYEGLLLTRTLDLKKYEMGALSNLANTYLTMGETEKAFAYFHESVALAEQLDDFPEQAMTMLSMARASLQAERYEQAKTCAISVLSIGRMHKQLGIQFEAHELLATLYKIEGDFENALNHFEAFHSIKESIFNKEADEKLKQLEVQHRTENAQRDAEIYQLRYVELQDEIAKRERAQKSLLQAQKLDSLGVLAGGVAHDFNNLLVIIMGHIDLALLRLDKTHAVHKNLVQASGAVDQAAKLADKMLAYSGRGRFQIAPCRLDQYIAKNQKLWRSVVGADCQIIIEPNLEVCFVEVDLSQIEQLIINLLVNAEEADAKTIIVRNSCYEITAHDSRFWQYTAKPLELGRYLLLTIVDDGVGMDTQTLEKVFDPFFTTKFTGRGLGLAASLGIIRGHNGGIGVQSQLNGGTVFEIVLPIVQKPVSQTARSRSSTKKQVDVQSIPLSVR